MSAVVRDTVTGGGVEGRRRLMFARGFGCDQNMWWFVAPVFAATHEIVVSDHVEAGRSETTVDGLSLSVVGSAPRYVHGEGYTAASVTSLPDNRAAMAKVRIPKLVLHCNDDVIASEPVGRFAHAHPPGSTFASRQACGRHPNPAAHAGSIATIRRLLSGEVATT